MANVYQLRLFCSFSDIIHHSWLIRDSHIFKVKVPVFFGFIIQSSMFVRVVISSIVPHPNIVTCSRKLKSRRKLSRIHDPLIRAIAYTVLKHDNWSISLGSWDSVHVKNITIFCCSCMFLKCESILFNNLLNVMFSVIKITRQHWS